jgi:putative glycosyltransferase (TIGR04372 family)
MTYSPGQITQELDYFFRRLHTGEISLDRKYVVVWPSESRWLLSDVARDTQKMYHERFHMFIVNNLIYYLILPLISRFPDITCDCGTSPENCSIIGKDGKLRSKTFPLITRTNRSCQEYLEINKYYNLLRLKTPGFCPLKPVYPMTSELTSFLAEVMPKYAVIQIRSARANGTLKPTDPLTYLEAIDFLRQNGFKIVFGGREAIPKIFSDLGVLNYANWEHASFFHDLHLIANSSFVLSSASGFAMMPSVMDIPLVYSNQWTIAQPQFGRLTVNVPTLLRNSDGRLMRFIEQIDYSVKTWGSNYYYNPHEVTLEPRVATSREILEATKEALSLKDTFYMPSDLQNQFNSLNSEFPIGNVDSRISQYFIESHQDLL